MGLFFIPILCALFVGMASFAEAEPIPVRFAEGTTHGYLALHTQAGVRIAQGELIQRTQGKNVYAQLRFQFTDGSIHNERVTYSQLKMFRMETYTLTQMGPSFATNQEIKINRNTKQYSFRSWAPGSRTITSQGTFELPNDVYNGMIVTLLKNLPPGTSKTVQYLAFTPKPKIYPLQLRPIHKLTVRMGNLPKQVTQYVLEPKVGLITRLVGKIMGKLPSKFHYHFWLYTDDVPVFGAFEGPLFVNGPTWRIEQSLPNLFSEIERTKNRFLANQPSDHKK